MVQIKALLNGPLHVTGEVKLTGKDGKEIDHQGDIFLCRCGHSNKKPFCDGSHKKEGFRD